MYTEKVAGKLSSNIFLKWISTFSKNSNWFINSLFNAKDLKLGHFGIFNTLFPFLALQAYRNVSIYALLFKSPSPCLEEFY